MALDRMGLVTINGDMASNLSPHRKRKRNTSYPSYHAESQGTLKLSGRKQPFYFAHSFCLSGMRTGQSRHGLSLLHSVWCLMLGRMNTVTGIIWRHLYLHGVSPHGPIWASLQHGGWCPRLCVPEQHEGMAF